MAGPDYIVDIGGNRSHPPGDTGGQKSSHSPLRGERWVAVQWRCCSVYSRVYRNRDRTAYEGKCPKCQRELSIPIGPDGTNNRFFEAY